MKGSAINNPLLIDLIVAAAILAFAFIRGKIGLLHTVVSVVIAVAAIAIGLVGSKMLLEPVAERVWESYSPKVEEKLDKEIDEALSGVSDLKSSFLNSIMEIPSSEAGGDLKDSELVTKIKTLAMVKAKLAVEKGCRLALFVVLTIAAFLILKLLSKMFKGVGDLPIIRTVNHGGGFVLGLIEALVVLIVVIRGGGLLGISYFSDMAEGTRLLSWLAGGNITETIASIKDLTLKEIEKLDLEQLKSINMDDLTEGVRSLMNGITAH